MTHTALLPTGLDYGPGFGGAPDPAMPDGFAALFVLALVAGIATTVWKVSTARRMARDAGMDEDDATAMTLLTDDGFEAAYTASSIRAGLREPATPPPPTAEARLTELRGLLDQGLVTQDEYDAARRRIIEGL
ncbi:hypothetical protein GCM10009623_04590 [Nocardioides aestuarii]|uniref:SHOCT domain-containing protein n=1 Tax=Nocardioides aestuarii TaxID=252231 RepID=A0ABW4TGW9_9ACTN